MAKAKKECVYMKGMTEALKKGKVPLSPAVKANGFVFVSGLPPIDTKTGKLITGDITKQTRQSLRWRQNALSVTAPPRPTAMRRRYRSWWSRTSMALLLQSLRLALVTRRTRNG